MTDRRVGTGAVAIAFSTSAAASAGFATAYITDAGTGWLGVTMAIALGGLGTGLVRWAKRLMPQGPASEPRTDLGSPRAEQETATTFAAGKEKVGRRRLLGGLLGTAAGALGLAAVMPVRSLGPAPGELAETGWQPGSRLVDVDGVPIRADTLAVGGRLTAFPEGQPQRAETQIVVIRLDEAVLQAGPASLDGTVRGNIAYSQVCTHAGCPVGMFQPDAHLLLCPCHQAAFDVADGGRAVFGPAPRSLPRLPLGTDEDGVLIASRDFTEPIGPDRWRMG